MTQKQNRGMAMSHSGGAEKGLELISPCAGNICIYLNIKLHPRTLRQRGTNSMPAQATLD